MVKWRECAAAGCLKGVGLFFINSMEAKKIRKKFLKFFEERGHAVVPSSSLIPDDPSVLLTTAGMQQFKPYYTGEADPIKDFGSKSTVSIQKSFRTSDIDAVGDETHLTFFEMLGNFSFGGYFKEEAITLAHEFITKEMGLPISYVTIFEGSDSVPKDEESRRIWQSLGVKDIREEGVEDVFWGPTGSSGPCGPTTEIYCKNMAGQDVEIWNCVFNQFFFPGSREELLRGESGKKLEPLATPGVDTGMGLERLAMISQGTKNIFETDLFTPTVSLFGVSTPEWSKRIIADHARGIVFLVADGVHPSNKNQGYILRRLMRRTIPHLEEHQYFEVAQPGRPLPVDKSLEDVANVVIDQYAKVDQYHFLLERREEILAVIREESYKFAKIYDNGKKILEKLIVGARGNNTYKLTGRDIFSLVSTYGFSIEWVKDIAKVEAIDLDLSGFEIAFREHQDISRAGVGKKFGGHGLLLDTGELKAGSEEELKIVTRLHTATHLLNAALHKVLGETVEQRGSDITAERTRFDFLFPRKLTNEEIQQVEELVNHAIEKDFPVAFQELSLEEAKKSGALFFYKGHYPERVKVYTVGDDLETFSKELCGGPHVAHTGEIGRLKIVKEESSSAGVRRIRAVVS